MQLQMVVTVVVTNCGYCGDVSFCVFIINTAISVRKQLETLYYCVPLDDGRMTETCCSNNIGRGQEELLTDPYLLC
jgi:ArsR family metal-binding transcriptional regulator